MKIGIIVAMGGEFRLVEALLSGKKEQEIRGYRYVTGQLGEKEIVLTQCRDDPVFFARLYTEYRSSRRD